MTLDRPQPPKHLLEAVSSTFEPAPDVERWLMEVFVEPDGPLFNEEHAHLLSARIGVLWTNVFYKRHGMPKGATAEIPRPPASQPRWAKERQTFQLRQWFGDVPDFLITVFAPYAATADDATFCALAEHELYHCGQFKDEWGAPVWRKDGSPVWSIRGHDVEQFTGIVRRYGVEAAGVAEMVEAANASPMLAARSIKGECGTCPV